MIKNMCACMVLSNTLQQIIKFIAQCIHILDAFLSTKNYWPLPQEWNAIKSTKQTK